MNTRSETRIPVRIFNAFSPSFKEFNPAELMEIVAKRYGRDDFGDDQFLEGFEVLCQSLSKDANLHAFGQIISKNMVLNSLLCRLELSQRWREYPDVLKTPVQRPIFIIGPARGGTTLLFNLLALDDRFRFFQTWEASRPGLPDDLREKKKAKERIRKTFGLFNYMRPNLKRSHYMTESSPEECNAILIHSFESVIFRYMFKVDAYYDWYSNKNHKYAYHYYTKQLQWMQRDSPSKRWLLKAPSHLLAFKTLVDQFPDAIFIQTHRDLLESIPSNCSLKYHFLGMSSYKIDKKEVGRYVMSDLSTMLKATCDVKPENRVDILYNDLIRHPIAALEKIYDRIGEPFSDAVKRLCLKYIECNPKDRFGRHHYSLPEFGLDKKTILDKFDFYNQRYLL